MEKREKLKLDSIWLTKVLATFVHTHPYTLLLVFLGELLACQPSDVKLTLPKLSEPVPDTWVTETGKYIMVYAINLSSLDPYTLLVPQSLVNDGILYLVIVRKGIARREMVRWLLHAKEAGHVGKKGFEVIPVRAFRIIPDRPTGYLSLDAESVPFGSFQGQLLGQKGRILTAA